MRVLKNKKFLKFVFTLNKEREGGVRETPKERVEKGEKNKEVMRLVL